jgi:DNA-binding transcriptional ArsR family regulator
MPMSKKDKDARRATLRPHPARDQILDIMRSYGKPISPTQIARIADATLGSIAYHVRTLLAAGLVELADEGRVRGAVEHFYALVDEERPDRKDPVAQLLSICGALTVPGRDGGYPRQVILDEPARHELVEIFEELQPQVRAIASASTDRAAYG